MNQFSGWKYGVIIISVILSLVYALPNLYGESPAIQIMPIKSGEKIEPSILASVESGLKEKNLAITGLIIEPFSIKIKFASPDEQLAAKSYVQQVLGESYVVALNLISNSPSWLTGIGALPMYLGLDLRGGVHFLMQLDLSKVSEKKSDGLLQDTRKLLRDEKVKYFASKKIGDTIEIKFRSADALSKAKDIIRSQGGGRGIFGGSISKTTEAYEFSEINNTDEFILLVKNNDISNEDTVSFALKQNLETLNNRVNELGVAEPIIQQQGKDRIVVQLPGVQDTAKAKEIIGRTAILEMRIVDEDQSSPENLETLNPDNLPLGTELYKDRFGNPILVKKEIILTGERIINAGPGVDQQTGQSIVSITLDSAGANIFKQVTRENVGKRIALLLIEKNITEVITAPVIKSEIGGGRVQITGMLKRRLM